ncbi:MAG: MotA/TolQ/ExbB proton channel family protein [Chitinispirillaceae bacterium]|nr:MotA/TolQ/ExbB proton channel family protein [Chitinispirillaceae bacterium]
MKKNLFFIFLALLSFASNGAKRPETDVREEQILFLKTKLESLRDSLHKEIAQRWKMREAAVAKKEHDKEEISELLDSQEKIFNQLTLSREENYSLQQRLETEQKKLDEKKVEQNYLYSVIDELLEKETEAIKGFFPSDIDSSFLYINKLRDNFSKKKNITFTIEALSSYFIATLNKGSSISFVNTTLLPEGSEALPIRIVQFGTVFGYGRGENGNLYTISQTGKEGVERYRIKKIENQELISNLEKSFESWSIDKRIKGSIPVDIVQSDLSGIMITGKKESKLVRFKKFIQAGGPVMFPLLFLPFWALAIIIFKLIQFTIKKINIQNFFKKAIPTVENGGTDNLRLLISKDKSKIAATIKKCIDVSKDSRETAEKITLEFLSSEIHWLNSYLNTLGVIAAVAPLLGLLGTVTGMIRLFEVITRYGTSDPKLLAGGISEALITTEVGLIIAIPILLIHNFLRNMKNNITTDLQSGFLKIINRLFING